MARALLCALALLLAPVGDASPSADVGLATASAGASQCQKRFDGADAEFSYIQPDSVEEVRLRQQPFAPRTVPLKSATTTTTEGRGATTGSPRTTQPPAKKTGEPLWILILVLVGLFSCCGMGIWIHCREDTSTTSGTVIFSGNPLTWQRNIDSFVTLSDIIDPPPCNEDQNTDDDENQEQIQLEDCGLPPTLDLTASLPPLQDVATSLSPPPYLAASLLPPADPAVGLRLPPHITRRFGCNTDDPPPYSPEDPSPPLPSASPVVPFHHAQAENPGNMKDF